MGADGSRDQSDVACWLILLCQVGWAAGHPRTCSDMILGVSLWMLLDEVSI